jgi:hypothetical protein
MLRQPRRLVEIVARKPCESVSAKVPALQSVKVLALAARSLAGFLPPAN